MRNSPTFFLIDLLEDFFCDVVKLKVDNLFEGVINIYIYITCFGFLGVMEHNLLMSYY